MLGDWESHALGTGQVADMSPRNAPEIRFRPNTAHVRRNTAGEVVVLCVSGNRLPPAGGEQPMPATLDSWEWDRSRDRPQEWIDRLVRELDR